MSEPFSQHPYFCEENAWHNLRHEALPGETRAMVFLRGAGPVFAIYNQRASQTPTGLIYWDYHVIAVAGPPWTVVDPDCAAGEQLPLADWLDASWPGGIASAGDFPPLFRVVPQAVADSEFASDRSHMKNPDGTWRQEPPPWAPIGEGHTLGRFLGGADAGLADWVPLDGLEGALWAL